MALSDALKQLKASVKGADNLPDGLQGAIATLETAITAYDGLDPQAARDALQQLEQRRQQDGEINGLRTEKTTLEQQLADANGTIQALTRQTAAVRGLMTNGVRPEYEDLLLPKVAEAVTLNDQGQAGFKDDYWNSLKTQYPAMFFGDDGAGTGDTSDTSGEGDKQPTSVQVSNGVVSGVDPADVLSGKVTLSMG
jgi:hypothetical protein